MKRFLCGIFLAGVLAMAACLFTGCATAEGTSSEDIGGSSSRKAVQSEERQFLWPQEGQPTAVISTSKGEITVALYPQYAPLAVENFCRLAALDYYAETTFHRVVRDFVIQGGDATGTGTGGHTVWGAPLPAEVSDSLHHYSGALCLAAGTPGGMLASQFYIVTTPQGGLTEETLGKLQESGMRPEVAESYRQAGGAPYLDYTDTVFGQVIDGMDVADAIARVSTNEADAPQSPVEIYSVTVRNPPQAPAFPQSIAPAEDAPSQSE